MIKNNMDEGLAKREVISMRRDKGLREDSWQG